MAVDDQLSLAVATYIKPPSTDESALVRVFGVATAQGFKTRIHDLLSEFFTPAFESKMPSDPYREPADIARAATRIFGERHAELSAEALRMLVNYYVYCAIK